jgi:hypothetical protein
LSRTGTANRPKDNSADDLGSIFAVLTTRVSGTNSTSIRYYSHLIPAFGLCTSRRSVLRVFARPISSCLHHHESMSRKVRLSTVLVGTRPDLAAPREGKMGAIGFSSGRNCTVGRLVANPWASQQHDSGRVVGVGALNRCGDIAKRRPTACRLPRGTKPEHSIEWKPGSVTLQPVRVLEYLTVRIGHLSFGARSAG